MKRLTRWNKDTENVELASYTPEEWKDFYNSLDVLDAMAISEALCKLAYKEDNDEYMSDYYNNYIYCYSGLKKKDLIRSDEINRLCESEENTYEY